MHFDLTKEELTAIAAIFMLMWYVVDIAHGLVHYVVFLRHQGDLFGDPMIRLYLVCLISGICFFATGGTVFLLRSIKYAVRNRAQRSSLVIGTSLVFFPYSLPISMLTLRMSYTKGFPDLVFALSLLVHGIGFGCGAAIVHCGYMWRMSRILETRFLSRAGVKTKNARTSSRSYGVVPLTAPPTTHLPLQSPPRPTGQPFANFG